LARTSTATVGNNKAALKKRTCLGWRGFSLLPAQSKKTKVGGRSVDYNITKEEHIEGWFWFPRQLRLAGFFF
jgi:hypothetical protein